MAITMTPTTTTTTLEDNAWADAPCILVVNMDSVNAMLVTSKEMGNATQMAEADQREEQTLILSSLVLMPPAASGWI